MPEALSARPLTPPYPADATLRVPVPGGTLFARVNGRLDSGRPPLIMAHGGPGGCHAAFLPALPLAADRAVILYDQLDCGHSDKPGDPANWVPGRFAAEVEAVRAAFGLDRYHLLGASWGGSVALLHGAAQPKGLASVILQGPLIATDDWIADAAILRSGLPADVQAALDAGDRSGRYDTPDYARATDAFYARYFRRRTPPAWATAYEKTIPQPFNARLYEAMWGPNEFLCTGSLKDFDGRPLLGRLTAPTLFLAGEFDEARPETVRRYAGLVRGADVAIVPGAAHRIQSDETAAYLAAVGGWLRRFD
ncbi:MAG: proline iminopeptidase-family hydrolase [Alphaproteobacteria bacterium]|nr:proline iminopeptidase-family hydrolase [Alphaproteobacteria bacterium]